MISVVNENIYDMNLISKVKEHRSPKTLEKIIKNLRNIEKEDVGNFSELKVEVFEEKREEEKKTEYEIIPPLIGFIHEDLKKPDSIVNNVEEEEGENTPSTVKDCGEDEQVESSDFSDDE